jgi:hypothetical protein
MLLDTICNIFGLLIFVAVIAAVLAQARTQTPKHVPSPISLPEPADAPMPDAPDVDINVLSNDLATARQHVADLESALQSLAPPDAAAVSADADIEHLIETLEA